MVDKTQGPTEVSLVKTDDTLTIAPAYKTPAGHRGRLRERFSLVHADGLLDYELLELLLTFSIARKDVKPLAKELIHRFGSLAGVMDAAPTELQLVADLGRASSTLIKVVKEICGAYLSESMTQRDLISSPDRVVDFATMKMAGLPHEAFMVIYLNTQNELILHEILNEGTIDQVAVYPRRILEKALARHAAGLILVHNHPSGHTDPSPDDKQLTRVVFESARLLNVRVLDHLIIGKGGHFSFLANGLLPSPADPTRSVL